MYATQVSGARTRVQSKVKNFASAVAAACTLSFGTAATAADWHDAFIGYTYGEKFKDPGSAADVRKNVFALSYVGGYFWGVNFFTLDMLTSDSNNPAKGPTLGQPSNGGAHEVYVVYNHTLSLSKISNTKVAFGPVSDIGIQTGFDYNSKNDTFGAGLYKIIAGPTFNFDIRGLLSLGLLYYKEYNNNGIVGKKVNFDATGRLQLVWGIPIPLGLDAGLKGFATYTGSKGLDGFGGQTKPETWLDTALLFDIGSIAGKPKTFFLGPGYQYIHNKFGNNAKNLPGSNVSAAQIKFEAHF